jgi:hypothetical protein
MMRSVFITSAAVLTLLLSGPHIASAGDCGGAALSSCNDYCGGATQVASCTRDGPTPICLCNETTKDVNGNAYGTATQETESGHGNLNPKTTGQNGGTTYPEESCTGNQGQCKKK